jgi:hypothetical protein
VDFELVTASAAWRLTRREVYVQTKYRP